MRLNRHVGTADFTRAVTVTKLNVVAPVNFWELERIITQRFDRGGKDGIDGWMGPQGQTGPYGMPGASGVGYGAHGHRGEDGLPGILGLHGNLGQNGQNGSDLNMSVAPLATDPDNLTLEVTDRGKSKSVISFNTANQFILMRAAGGNAGAGGRGGKGGTGGADTSLSFSSFSLLPKKAQQSLLPGGDGAAGRPGGNTQATCNGGPGGNGGDGGNGGAGGMGGRGGDGGCGGHSGRVTVSITDPVMLMAIRIDVEGGFGGAGGGPGPGGDGGAGGPGGLGGPGGPPGSYTTTESYSYTDANGNTHWGTRTVTHWGSPGSPGFPGSRGLTGPTGPTGSRGNPGASGNEGSVQFLWKDPLGKVIEKGTIGYNLRLVSLEIEDSMHDGIFEPLEEITITNVTLLNDGDMTVPAGAIFSLLGSDDITPILPDCTNLPNLPPGQSMVLTQAFKMKLGDVPIPTAPGPLKTTFHFNTNATLLKRQFLKSGVTFGATIEWPIHIASIASPTQMARNETRPFLVTITNRSLIPYAASPETEAVIVLQFEPGLFPIDPRATGEPGGKWTLPIPLTPIEPGASVTVSVDVTAWEGTEFFHRTPWRVDLLLRNRLIEFSTQQVRLAPDWHNDFADVPRDVIMFTADHISEPDYLAWKSICKTLRLGLWMWDSERFHGISADSTTGEPHGATSWRAVPPGPCIVFPSNPNGPQGLNFADVVAHFMKFPMSTGTVQPGKYIDDAGFLFFGGDPAGIDKQMAWNGEPVDIADWNLKFEGKHLPIFKPDDKDIMDKAVSLTKKIGEKDPGYPYRLMAIEKEVDRESFLKYSYGTLIIKKLPFKKFSKFVYAPRAISSSISQSDLNATSLPLHSPYGQCMTLLISVLPVHKKLHALGHENAPINFTMIDGKKELVYWPLDLLKVLLYRDLRSDLEHDEKDYPHALALQEAVLADPKCLQNLNIRLAIFYALERLSEKKSVFSSNKPINNIKEAIKKPLFELFKEDEYKQMKKNNEAAIKEHKRFRMHQYFAESVSWLFANKKK